MIVCTVLIFGCSNPVSNIDKSTYYNAKIRLGDDTEQDCFAETNTISFKVNEVDSVNVLGRYYFIIAVPSYIVYNIENIKIYIYPTYCKVVIMCTTEIIDTVKNVCFQIF